MAFMTHPQHGATNTQDVAEHEKNGWTVSTPEAWISGKNADQVIDEVAADTPKKRGPKAKAE